MTSALKLGTKVKLYPKAFLGVLVGLSVVFQNCGKSFELENGSFPQVQAFDPIATEVVIPSSNNSDSANSGQGLPQTVVAVPATSSAFGPVDTRDPATLTAEQKVAFDLNNSLIPIDLDAQQSSEIKELGPRLAALKLAEYSDIMAKGATTLSSLREEASKRLSTAELAFKPQSGWPQYSSDYYAAMTGPVYSDNLSMSVGTISNAVIKIAANRVEKLDKVSGDFLNPNGTVGGIANSNNVTLHAAKVDTIAKTTFGAITNAANRTTLIADSHGLAINGAFVGEIARSRISLIGQDVAVGKISGVNYLSYSKPDDLTLHQNVFQIDSIEGSNLRFASQQLTITKVTNGTISGVVGAIQEATGGSFKIYVNQIGAMKPGKDSANLLINTQDQGRIETLDLSDAGPTNIIGFKVTNLIGFDPTKHLSMKYSDYQRVLSAYNKWQEDRLAWVQERLPNHYIEQFLKGYPCFDPVLSSLASITTLDQLPIAAGELCVDVSTKNHALPASRVGGRLSRLMVLGLDQFEVDELDLTDVAFAFVSLAKVGSVRGYDPSKHVVFSSALIIKAIAIAAKTEPFAELMAAVLKIRQDAHMAWLIDHYLRAEQFEDCFKSIESKTAPNSLMDTAACVGLESGLSLVNSPYESLVLVGGNLIAGRVSPSTLSKPPVIQELNLSTTASAFLTNIAVKKLSGFDSSKHLVLPKYVGAWTAIARTSGVGVSVSPTPSPSPTPTP